MNVTINGKDTSLDRPMPISELIQILGIDLRLVAIAHNGEVIAKQTLDTVLVQNGDKLEIVRMVGGGA